MAGHDIITIGASAGGVEALVNLVQQLPASLPAAVFVVLHVPPHYNSHLPQILSRRGSLQAAHARNGEPIISDRIYVAPPDHHMILRQGVVLVTRGPRENGSRPAVDPLFRSAARVFGPRVVGIVLSGALYDGALGLELIKARGGIAVVQDPTEAIFDSMPRAALRSVPAAKQLTIAEMAEHIPHLVTMPVSTKGLREMEEMEDIDNRGTSLIRTDISEQEHDQRANQATIYTCPECGGTLWQIAQEGLTQFRCHVGHAYGIEVLASSKSEELEAVLWRCVRLLVEKATLSRQLSERMRAAGHTRSALRLEDQADEDDRQGQLVRDLLNGLSSLAPPASAVEVLAELADPDGSVAKQP